MLAVAILMAFALVIVLVAVSTVARLFLPAATVARAQVGALRLLVTTFKLGCVFFVGLVAYAIWRAHA